MHNVLSLVLGGGRGTRLYPLTKFRSKPAVPVMAKYRLIDIPLSNCINNGLNRIYVLTQFNSVSLHRHIRRTYTFDSFSGGFVEVLAAQQTIESTNWYQGTADAVRKNLRYLQQPGIDYVLILSGDQLYRMDFLHMLDVHRQAGADVTIATMPVHNSEAHALGIMRIDETGRVRGFLEKPQTPDEVAMIRTEPSWIDSLGLPSRGRDCLASMGIYLFNRDTLVDVLSKTEYPDFGKEIFPATIRARHVQAYLFDGYWEDIGTIKAFYQANLALAGSDPPFDLHRPEAPIYTRARFLPSTRSEGATVKRSLLADGCILGSNVVIENSIVGVRCRIGDNVTIRNSILMGADFYQTPEEIEADRAAGRPIVGLGNDVLVDGAIVDKNCRIGNGVRIENPTDRETSPETAEGLICDGIICIHREATLPDGWKMG